MMMKKWIALLLLLAMMSCAACGSNENNESGDGNIGGAVVETENAGSQEQEKEESNQSFSGEITEEVLRTYPENPATDFEYSMSLDYEGIEITSYKGTGDIVIIPESIDGMPVVEIGGIVLGSDSTVRAVRIPETVVEIGGSFPNNECLELVIAEGVQIIGMASFQNCPALKEVVLGDTVTEIGMSAFAGCTALEKLMIPETLSEISDEALSAFVGCSNLTIYGVAGSYIETFANEMGIPFVAE